MPNTQQPSLATQQFVNLESVNNGVVKLKNGSFRKILMVSGINFDLKSSEEQEMIIMSFQGFLNTLDFSLQFFIHSRKLNIESYLKKMEELESKETNELLKNQIFEYREFIKSFVSQNAIMSKTFFVIIPFDPIQLPGGAKGVSSFFGMFGSKNTAAETKKQSEQENFEQLEQRTEEVASALNSIGLRAVPLNDEELSELFYNLYNPSIVEKKG